MFAIRRAEPADEAELFGLTKAFAKSFQHLIHQENAALFVAERIQELTGYLLGFDHYSLSTNGRISWVEELMVREGCGRHGLGRELMTALERRARQRDSQLIALATRRAVLHGHRLRTVRRLLSQEAQRLTSSFTFPASSAYRAAS